MRTILVVLGTRPEVIKLFPVMMRLNKLNKNKTPPAYADGVLFDAD